MKDCPIKNAILTQLFFFRTKTNSAANNGKWHHICLVWTSDGGKVTIHNDNSILSGDGFSSGETIPGMQLVVLFSRRKYGLWEQLKTKKNNKNKNKKKQTNKPKKKTIKKETYQIGMPQK